MNQRLRRYVFDREGGCCALCGRTGTDLHHEPNKGMGGEKDADRPNRLILLCRECHERRTGRINAPDGEQTDYKMRIVMYLHRKEGFNG